MMSINSGNEAPPPRSRRYLIRPSAAAPAASRCCPSPMPAEGRQVVNRREQARRRQSPGRRPPGRRRARPGRTAAAGRMMKSMVASPSSAGTYRAQGIPALRFSSQRRKPISARSSRAPGARGSPRAAATGYLECGRRRRHRREVAFVIGHDVVDVAVVQSTARADRDGCAMGNVRGSCYHFSDLPHCSAEGLPVGNLRLQRLRAAFGQRVIFAHGGRCPGTPAR